MGRTVAVVWHALISVVAGILYFFFVLPRWWELSGQTSHTLGTVMRIVAGALIALAALPVVLTLLRTRRPEYGTPQLALRLRVCSIVLHVLGGVLIIGAAVSEIWLSLDAAGPWLFGIYGAAAAICLLGIFSFYLAFVAELPPPPPRPLKKKKERKRRWRRKGADEAGDEDQAEDEGADEDEAGDKDEDEASSGIQGRRGRRGRRGRGNGHRRDHGRDRRRRRTPPPRPPRPSRLSGRTSATRHRPPRKPRTPLPINRRMPGFATGGHRARSVDRGCAANRAA